MVPSLGLIGLQVASSAAGGVANALGASASPAAKAKKTATEFETMFLEGVFDRITEGGGAEGPFGEAGTGGEVYRSMLAKEYAGQVVRSGGVGIADSVYRQLLQLQEASGGGG